MTEKKRLTFEISPKHEHHFLDVEAILRNYIKNKEPVPSDTVALFLDLLYARRKFDTDIRDVFTHALKQSVTVYFKDDTHYWFAADKDGVEYSLKGWVDLYFDNLLRYNFTSRSQFIIDTVHSLDSYAKQSGRKLISLRARYIITGYICSLLNFNVRTPKEYELAFEAKEVDYRDYKEYLAATIRSIVNNRKA